MSEIYVYHVGIKTEDFPAGHRKFALSKTQKGVCVRPSVRPAVHCYDSISTQTHWCCCGTPCGLCKHQILLFCAAVGTETVFTAWESLVRHDLDRKISWESWGEKPKRIYISLEVGIARRRGRIFLPDRKLFHAARKWVSAGLCIFIYFLFCFSFF